MARAMIFGIWFVLAVFGFLRRRFRIFLERAFAFVALLDKKRADVRLERAVAPGDVSGFVRGDCFVFIAGESAELVHDRAFRIVIYFHAVYFDKTRVN